MDAELKQDLIKTINALMPLAEEASVISGYGFYRPANPHDFSPDHESCSEEEIENHRRACEAFDKGEYVPEAASGWITPTIHVTRAPWGIGSYSEVMPRGLEVLERARQALAALAA